MEKCTETFLKKIAAIYQDDEDETRVDISARQWSQAHSQGHSQLVSEKEIQAARMAQPITWLESNWKSMESTEDQFIEEAHGTFKIWRVFVWKNGPKSHLSNAYD